MVFVVWEIDFESILEGGEVVLLSESLRLKTGQAKATVMYYNTERTNH